jgi:hypothetical protein
VLRLRRKLPIGALAYASGQFDGLEKSYLLN